MRLTLHSVNVGKPAAIGEVDGVTVVSAISKTPVSEPMIDVQKSTLNGDGVADRSVHGGPNKAVYAYPRDHWDWWTAEADLKTFPGAFGENLTLEGATEHDIQIGDLFRWGDTILQVSQPRAPCYKFRIYTGRDDAAARMTVSGRCGWYFRILQPGSAPTSGVLERTESGTGASVYMAFMAAFNRRFSKETRAQIASDPALATEWRQMLTS